MKREKVWRYSTRPALLAWLQAEPGADEVRLEGALINSVNWSEVLQKAEQKGVEVEGVREENSRRSGF